MLTGKLLYLSVSLESNSEWGGLFQHHPQLANGTDFLPTSVVIGKNEGLFDNTIQLSNL